MERGLVFTPTLHSAYVHRIQLRNFAGLAESARFKPTLDLIESRSGEQRPSGMVGLQNAAFEETVMTDFNRNVPPYNDPLDRSSAAQGRTVNPTAPSYSEPPRVAVVPRAEMATTGPLFSSFDIVAGIFAAVMMLGPLAMAAFSVGRY